MARILVFSDIHGAVPAVESLVAAESRDFDAVVVAGDIGPQPTAFFRALEPLGCPVLYVYGNWDHALSYEYVFHKRFVHLHGTSAQVGGLHFVGFSGCGEQWGQNPYWLALNAETQHAHRAVLARLEVAKAADRWAQEKIDKSYDEQAAVMSARALQRGRQPSKNRLEALERKRNRTIELRCRRAESVRDTRAFRRYADTRAAAWNEVLAQNRHEVVERVHQSQEDPARFVFVSHARLFRLHEDIPGLGAHLFGHIHGFKVTTYKGTTLVNVSVLDPRVAEHHGTYGVIEWTPTMNFKVLGRRLAQESDLWVRCMEYQEATSGLAEPEELRRPIPRNPWW